MALNKETKTSEASQPKQADGVILTLAMHKNYSMQGHLYKGGEGYLFARADAMRLLKEQDMGRPVWKQWVRPAPPPSEAPVVRDAMQVSVPIPIEEGGQLPQVAPGKAINVGDNSELSDIPGLTNPDADDPGNVTI